MTTNWPRIEKHVAEVGAQVDGLQPGSFVEIVIP
jgi:hypothetical protein